MILDGINYVLWGWNKVFSNPSHIHWIVLSGRINFSSWTENELLWFCLKKQEKQFSVTNNEAKWLLSTVPLPRLGDTGVISTAGRRKARSAPTFDPVIVLYVARSGNFSLTSLSSYVPRLVWLSGSGCFLAEVISDNSVLPWPRISPTVS